MWESFWRSKRYEQVTENSGQAHARAPVDPSFWQGPVSTWFCICSARCHIQTRLMWWKMCEYFVPVRTGDEPSMDQFRCSPDKSAHSSGDMGSVCRLALPKGRCLLAILIMIIFMIMIYITIGTIFLFHRLLYRSDKDNPSELLLSCLSFDIGLF